MSFDHFFYYFFSSPDSSGYWFNEFLGFLNTLVSIIWKSAKNFVIDEFSKKKVKILKFLKIKGQGEGCQLLIFWTFLDFFGHFFNFSYISSCFLSEYQKIHFRHFELFFYHIIPLTLYGYLLR